jgi:hypothetical protein
MPFEQGEAIPFVRHGPTPAGVRPCRVGRLTCVVSPLMSERASLYLAFFGTALALWILIDGGFDILARVRIGGQSPSEALSETAHYLLAQPLGTLFSFAPFAAVAWICSSLARMSRPRALGLFAACMAVFAYMYYVGHSDSHEYMRQRMWTAASLAVGLIPFKSIPIVLVAFGLRFALGRTHAPTKA